MDRPALLEPLYEIASRSVSGIDLTIKHSMDFDAAFPADRPQWFRDARLGMFIHWGLFSLLGRGGWAMSRERTPIKEYVAPAGRFRAENLRLREWAWLAQFANMRYVVLTTEHHEGFCLWNPKICAFNAVRSAVERDLLAEFIDAVRGAGLKVGLYWFLGEWFNPDWAASWQGDTPAKTRFMHYTYALVHELLSDYVATDALWYDLPQCYSASERRSVAFNAMVRRFQPLLLINNRALTTEDLTTPEQHIAASAPGRRWEACIPLNDSRGFRPCDQH